MKLVFFVVVLLLELVGWSSSLVIPSHRNTYGTKIWKMRLEAAVSLMRKHPCINSQANHNCNRTLPIPRRDMNVYMAAKGHPNERLRARLPDRKHRSLLPNDRNIDGVIVIDPYPKANFGHLVYIFFVEENGNRVNCTRRNLTASFIGTGDCIIAATKSHCKNAVRVKKRKKCYIDFLPLVFVDGDASKTQILSCQDGLFGFGKCRKVAVFSPPHQRCANSPRCSNVPRAPQKTCISKRCDYAVMVSGGWTPLTAHPRHAKNLQKFWQFLRDNQFKKEHITTFYGSDGNIELDGDPSTQDAVAAVTDFGVTDYLAKLCRSRWCVDTLVLYLTGPARSNGALLMWDINGDGLTENKEMFAIHEIFKQLSNCNAKRVFIVADYSYSGHLVHKLQELRRHRHRDSYSRITVITSSESNEYAWQSEFTQTFIKFGKQNKTRSMRQLFQEVKTNFHSRKIHSRPTFAEGSKNLGNLTIYGGKSGEQWNVASRTSMGCKLIPVTEIGNGRSRHKHKGSS